MWFNKQSDVLSYCFFSVIFFSYTYKVCEVQLCILFVQLFHKLPHKIKSNKCNFTCILQQQNGKQSITEVLLWGSVLQLSLEDLQVLPCQLGNVVSHSVMLILSVRFNNCLRSDLQHLPRLSQGKNARVKKRWCSRGLPNHKERWGFM